MRARAETSCQTWNVAAQIEQKQAGRRKNIRHGGTLCSKCLVNPPSAKNQRYCKPCHNEAVKASYRRKQDELIRLRQSKQEMK